MPFFLCKHRNFFPRRALLFSSLIFSSTLPLIHEPAYAGGDHWHNSHEPEVIESNMIQLETLNKEKDAQDDLISQKLADAVSLTAKRKLDEARKAYEQIAIDHPEAGIPALSRFYSLTASSEELEQFISSLLEDELISDLIKARTLVQANERLRAADFLADSSESKNIDGQTALFFAQLLDQLGSHNDATQFTIDFLKQNSSSDDSLLMAKYLLSREVTMNHDQPIVILETLEKEIAHHELDYETVTLVTDNLIFGYLASNNYFLTRPEMIKNASDSGPLSRIFISKLLLNEGNPWDSLEILNEGQDFSNIEGHMNMLVAKESIQRHIQIGEYDEADKIRQQITEHDIAQSDAYTNFIAMQTELSRSNLDKAHEYLKTIDGDSLQGRERHDYYLTSLRFASKFADYELIVKRFGEYFARYDRSNSDLIYKVVFETMNQTEDHVGLEEYIRDLFDKEPEKTDPYLWLLAAESAKEARLKPNELEAKYQYILAKPDDVIILESLVNELVPIATDLNNIEESDLMTSGISLEEPAFMMKLAEDSALALINAKPYAPEPLRRLMELYRAQGKTDDEVSAVVDLVGEKTNNSKIIGNLGYVLATEGFPEKALTYYNRALEINPEDFKIKLNVAACYTHLGRWNDAVEFYQNGLTNGFKGKPYHVHEFAQRLWAIADTIGTKEKTLEYFEEVAYRNDIPWQTETISNIISLMILDGNYDEAEKFLNILSKVSEESQKEDDFLILARSYQKIASGYAGKEEFDASRSVLESGISYFEGNPQVRNKLKENLATMYVEAGESAKAIDILVEVGTEATLIEDFDFIYFAASIAERDGDVFRAAELYKQFLSSESRSFSLRRKANDRLSALGLE